MDPVLDAGLNYQFYRLTRDLRIDVDHLRTQLELHRPQCVLFVHYFGYVDPSFEHAAALSRQFGALIVEDEAHAVLSDLVAGGSGRTGDACIASLHKVLPVDSGGLLILNSTRLLNQLSRDIDLAASAREAQVLLCYDLPAIAEQRRRNSALWIDWASTLPHGSIAPLWGTLPDGCVPQSAPFVLLDGDRDMLHSHLNEMKFGTVSLYHTLARQVDRVAFPDAYWLSDHIINFPVHQDAEPQHLREMQAAIERWLCR